ncbi:MAG: hypothetical protein AAF402_17480 [Pseudomonadota bacterium]
MTSNAAIKHAPEGLSPEDVRRVEGLLFAWAEWWSGDGNSHSYAPTCAGVNWHRLMGEPGVNYQTRRRTDKYTSDTYDLIQSFYRKLENEQKQVMKMRYLQRHRKATIKARLKLKDSELQRMLGDIWIRVNNIVNWDVVIIA